MRLVLHKEIPEDQNLRRQWNALVERVAQPQVFYTYEWALAVHRAYGATLGTLLFLAYDDQDSLCGVAALALNENRDASFLTATTGDYCDFLSLPEHKSAFVGEVLAELRKQGIGDVTLTNLPADSDSVAALRQASRENGYRCFARTAYLCAQIVLADLERRPGETKPVLPRKKMVRRFLSAMSREAPVRIEHTRSWGAVQPALPIFVQTHVARFLFTGRISNMARPERRLFLEELAKLLSESGWLVLTRMMSGAKSHAWNYGFRFRDTWFWYQPTFDSDLEKYSPGFCLLVKLVEEAAGDPTLKIVDLGLGAEDYKERFASQTRETLYVTLKRSAARHYREILRYYAAEVVRASPKIEAGVRAVVRTLSGIRARVSSEGIGGALSWMGRRLRELWWLKSEVFFYEYSNSVLADSQGRNVRTLDLNQLACAASQYVDDRATLDYLLRAASRLQEGKAAGYGLVDAEGRFLHFAWATEFEGFFLSELNAKVGAPSPACMMLFDCWTPASARGHGYYGYTIAMIAKLVREQGKQPWIFSAKENVSSIRGVEKAGFQRRYSLVRQRLLGWQRIKGKTPVSQAAIAEEVSARV